MVQCEHVSGVIFATGRTVSLVVTASFTRTLGRNEYLRGAGFVILYRDGSWEESDVPDIVVLRMRIYIYAFGFYPK